MNERAINVLRGQLAERGVDDAAELSADEVLARGVEAGLITEQMADEYRGSGEAD